jgi:uncharacterized protein
MKIEYDAAKNDTNVRERGLSFDRAAEFEFDSALVQQDSRKDYQELRYVAIGYLESRLHVLCFTGIDGGIRVISFRKANSREVKIYEQASK